MTDQAEAVVKIGTSGYSFLDWIGPFYPEGIERGKMLDYYIQHFKTVEINSSYYGIPHPRVFENMIKKVPEGFEFFVKAHRSLTHDRKEIIAPINQFLEAVTPLKEAGMLSGVLLQFPFSFKYNPYNLVYIRRAKDMLAGCDVIVEFRHRGWVREDVFKLFKEEQIIYCSVDEPNLDQLIEPDAIYTTKTGYVRFHGRNRQTWWSGGGERYDYLYTDAQLSEWALKINKMKETTDRIYLFFNNCHHGQAVKNAKMMMEILQSNIGASK